MSNHNKNTYIAIPTGKYDYVENHKRKWYKPWTLITEPKFIKVKQFDLIDKSCIIHKELRPRR